MPSSSNLTVSSLFDTSGILSGGMIRNLITTIASIGLGVSVFGAAGNIVNIIVYIRLGFSESTHVSLTALACSDLVGVITAVCTQIFYLPIFDEIAIIPETFVFTISSWPHVVVTRISGFITAFISLERFLCVFLPLKIKSIFTPKRTFIVMVVIYSAVFPPMIVVYFRYPLGMMFLPQQNRSVLTILPINDSVVETSFRIFQVYASAVLPILSFFIVTSCTILLTLSLQRSKKWRDANRSVVDKHEQLSGATKSTETSKETRAVKMVVAIATVFIISAIPSCVHIIVNILVPGFDITGRYANMYRVTGHVFFVLDLLNCSANIIIYYRMSTKFRQAVHELFAFKCLVHRDPTKN